MKDYDFVVSPAPYPGARLIGEGIVGRTFSVARIRAFRRQFTEEIKTWKGIEK